LLGMHTANEILAKAENGPKNGVLREGATILEGAKHKKKNVALIKYPEGKSITAKTEEETKSGLWEEGKNGKRRTLKRGKRGSTQNERGTFAQKQKRRDVQRNLLSWQTR